MRNGLKLSIIMISLLCFVGATSAMADDLKDAQKYTRNAQRLYFNGKAADADVELKKAEEIISQVKSGNDPVAASKVKLIEGKTLSLRKNINKKLGISSSAEPSMKSQKPSVSSGAQAQTMPSSVVSRLKGVNSSIENSRMWLEKKRISTARRSMQSAIKQMEKIEKSYAGRYPPDHEDVVATKKNLEDLVKAIDDAEAKLNAQATSEKAAAEQAESVSAEWISRLIPYIKGKGQPGYDPDRYFVASFSEDEQEMNQRTAVFSRLQSEMAEYRQSGPGENATDELKNLVKRIEYEIETFTESCRTAGTVYIDKANFQLDFLLKRMNEESKKIGTGELPSPVSKKPIQDAKLNLDRAANLLGAQDSRVAGAETKYQKVLQLDAELWKARVSETRMIPDKFTGKGKSEIKKKAHAVLKKEHPGAKVLRTTIISEAWIEERVIEWTDTTRSQLRGRITQHVSVQVAGKTDGETKIYTIYVAKNRRSDGSWGALYGHVMFRDPILPENVNK